MKLLTLGGGFSDEELSSFTHIIYSNCISQMKVLVTVMPRLELEYELPENEVFKIYLYHYTFTYTNFYRVEEKELKILHQLERLFLMKLPWI